MKSEFQFFMAPEDEAEFDRLITSFPEIHVKRERAYDSLMVGSEFIQFIRSRHEGEVIKSGRIALLTQGDSPAIEKIYKKMRSWLKRSYSNKLIAFNVCNPQAVISVKYMWAGPVALQRLDEGTVSLRDFAAVNVSFVRLGPNHPLKADAPGGPQP